MTGPARGPETLATVHNLNQGAGTVFQVDGDDIFTNGRYKTFGPNVPFAQVVARLRGTHKPGGDVIPAVWVKDRSAFVPVTELDAAA